MNFFFVILEKNLIFSYYALQCYYYDVVMIWLFLNNYNILNNSWKSVVVIVIL